jgi:large subunit ribosomal protein L10e
MALRKAGSYSKFYAMPYTRKSKVKKKSFIKTVPNPKVVKFKMGDVSGYNKGKYPIQLEVYTTESVQIRDNAIEAMRQYLHRFLTEQIGKDYYFEIKTVPHHILRENRMLTGAGADRMQTGMALSFGVSMSRASLIKAGKMLFLVSVLNPRHEQIARKLRYSSKTKLPCKIHVETKIKKFII